MAAIQQLSPGVVIREIDLTNLSSSFENISNGGNVGQFIWGPVGTIVPISSKNDLRAIFGDPTDANYIDWYTASNFLDYSDNLLQVRVVDETSDTPAQNSSVVGSGLLVKNPNHYQSLINSDIGVSDVFVAKYPGILGDSIKISLADSNTFSTWTYSNLFDIAPGTSEFAQKLGAENDELHILVIDEDGKFTGIPGAILEKYEFLSKATDAKDLNNKPIFYGDVLNNESNFIWYFGPIQGSSDLDIASYVSTIAVDQGHAGLDYGNPVVTLTAVEGDTGIGATAVATLANDGSIASIAVTNPGAGYNTAPDVTITDGGTGATAKAIATDGVITAVVPLLSGKGYGRANVAITDQASGFAGGTVTLASTGGIKSASLVSGGNGYHVGDVVTLGGGTGGTLTVATVDNTGETPTHAILTYTMTTAGTGYSTNGTGVATTVSPSGGTGATFNTVIGKGISTVAITSGGTHYAANPRITLTGGTPTTAATLSATVVEGVITHIAVTSPGVGYSSAPTASVSTGSGADVTAVIGTKGSYNEGKVVAFVISDGGTNYNNPLVTITAGGPSYAEATATATLLVDSNDATNWGTTCSSTTGVPRTFFSLNAVIDGAYSASLTGGNNGLAPNSTDIIAGWDLFKNAEEVDVGLLFVGAAGGESASRSVIQHVIDDVVLQRLDCVAFMSPNLSDVLNKDQYTASRNVVDFLNNTQEGVNRNTSYAVCDSGWKLQFDVINNKYRWVPLNADIAGLCARTENNFESWYSPAGLVKGKIQNAVSLAFNPNKESRDVLYKANINPVVSFTAEGVVLFGDKTLQIKNSALSFLNVRRLLISLERYINKIAKLQLFEFNDEYTRTQFTGLVEPYLRDVKSKRGVYDYKIVCDETNNTADVIDSAQFIASIFVKPTRSINFITLNFVIVRTGVQFSEVVGQI